MDAWDMPFSVIDGTTLDVAIGAPGSCSRHTDGQTHESNANKAFCMNPTTMTLEQLHDATAFADRDPAKIQAILQKGGFSKTGTERFCSGTTGEMIDVAIFVGMVYMQKLKHMVSDKHHACMVAPRNPVTQQPCSGRFNGGALKTGTMELDALVAHGAEDLVSEFLRTESDPAWMWCCTKCGSITTVMVGNTFCVMCGGKNTGKPMPTVGFFKVLVNELACLNIRCTLPLKKLEVLDKFHEQRLRARELNARLGARCGS
jgi:DNA-directed RNA polymerase beta subunit